jgi:hypothetical protein
MNLYYKIFQTHIKKTPDLADIEAIQSLLHKHEYSIDWETLHELYIHLRNIVLIMLGADRDRKELLEVVHNLYVDSLQRGYLHFENKLPASRYLAVTENALKINQFEWVRDFIESNKDQLHNENENHDIYHFVKARYLFAIGQFEECLDILPDTSPFVDFMLLGKRLELKVLYEIKSDLLSYKLDAFKMFLSRTSTKILSDIQRRTHVDFTNLLTQIISSIPGDKTRAEKLLSRIQDNKQVAERIWLSEKAAELKKG